MIFCIKKVLSIHYVPKVWKMRSVLQTAYKTNALTKEQVTNYPCILSSFNIKHLHEYYGFSIVGKKPLKTLVNFSDLS